MGFTEEKLQDLKEKGFDKLFEKHKALWVTMANTAYANAKDNITGGNPPRPDDILKMLLPMLEPNVILRKHQEENSAWYKRFREYFAEYIIDLLFFRPKETT